MFELDTFQFKDTKAKPDAFYDYSSLRNNVKIPIIVDNGSYQSRAGFATSEVPQLVFRNVIAKTRVKKQESETLIGNDIYNIEASRSGLRSQFDRNVVVHYDVQEKIFDYIFSHLGIDTDGCVSHPMVLTEAPFNPLLLQSSMIELLFECYRVPKVTFGIDSLFSFYQNISHNIPSADALVISLGYQTLHVLPVLNGVLDVTQCRRVNIGGLHVESYLHRLCQLKYPEHSSSLSLTRAEELVRDHCHFAIDYLQELRRWSDVSFYNKHVHRVQLPVTKVAMPMDRSEEVNKKRSLQIKRLHELHRRRKEERLTNLTNQLQKEILACDLLDSSDQWVSVSEGGAESRDELLSKIENMKSEIAKLTQSLTQDMDKTENKEVGDAKSTQRNKMKMKVKTERVDALDELRSTNLSAWVDEMRSKRESILEKITERKKLRSDMSKRRTFASQLRMQKLNKLAAGDKLAKKHKKAQDNFGLHDSDWDVYKEINLDADTDSDTEALNEIDTLLTCYDPQMLVEETDNDYDNEEKDRLHLAVEQIRAPEVLFQPSMLGESQGGLAETIDFVLSKYPPEVQSRLCQCIYVTGGPAHIPNLKDRLIKEMQEIRPFQSSFRIHMAASPSLDSWKGARLWSVNNNDTDDWLTLSSYDELGVDYLRSKSRHRSVFMPKP